MVTQKDNQRKKILRYIDAHGSATVRELFIFCRINSPSKRLSEMRKLGWIDTVKCTEINADGETKRFCRYYLTEEAKKLLWWRPFVEDWGGKAH